MGKTLLLRPTAPLYRCTRHSVAWSYYKKGPHVLGFDIIHLTLLALTSSGQVVHSPHRFTFTTLFLGRWEWIIQECANESQV